MTNDLSSRPANLGWRVTFAGMGINLALGILYTWSVISARIPKEWGWSEAEKSLPYAIACLVFSLMMVPAGRMQDRLGPRLVATMGGILVGAGMILASLTTNPYAFMLGFGLLAGTGIGFGYAAATPPAVKWFPKKRTGLVTGIVVAGFGLASVYASPVAKTLIGSYGVPTTMMIFGAAFLVVVVVLSQLLRIPPAGYVPRTPLSTGSAGAAAEHVADSHPGQMLRNWQFYALWFMFACGAGAGLMVISKLDAIAKKQAGLDLGFLLVAVLAIGNGGGRILAGMISDKIGRKTTLFICFLVQAVVVLVLSQATAGSALASVPVLAVISALVGANYGANLALFPSVTKDYYGLKNFGVNYGCVFTAWGVGGFMLSYFAGMVYDGKIVDSMKNKFDFAYYAAAVLLVLAAITVLFLRPPKPAAPKPQPKEVEEEALQYR